VQEIFLKITHPQSLKKIMTRPLDCKERQNGSDDMYSKDVLAWVI